MKKLVWLALILACMVVPLGAYVRLSDAGLGCPDWPGCYGELSPHHAVPAILQAERLEPDGPVSVIKAWKEMVHRYLAASLGLLIVAIAVQAFRCGQQRRLAGLLLAVVIVQGLLGMWTVTLLLKPVIVTAHLIGGVSIILLLAWLALAGRWATERVPPSLFYLSWLLVLLLCLQIMLGGWVSTNYAALACQGFPACNGDFWPVMRFDHAFHLFRELGETAAGTPLDSASLVAIHWLHRVGAFIVSCCLSLLVFKAWRFAALRMNLYLLLLVWALQVILGIANVWFMLPLPVAVAHNACAVLLLSVALLFAGRLRLVSLISQPSVFSDLNQVRE
ncbi:COX15/CtaA family protein [Neisseriaceae bacterium TC5R-5]|nr:COX15/CtaA family protein [Neisseriaceae bacterium TC5R-5]